MPEKRFKINTSEIGYIYIDNPKEEHMSWVELEKTLNRLYTQNKELFNENKELKQVIKEVLKLLEEVDLFSDKATEHDINAYIELREFDNKDAYYMAISTKKAIKLLKEMIE